MTSRVADAATALTSALGSVKGLRAYNDPAATIQPPAAVVGPPELEWEGYTSAVMLARFVVYLVTTTGAHVLEQLWDLVPLVVSAVEDQVPGATVLPPASPGVFNAGGTELPCYQITIEVAP